MNFWVWFRARLRGFAVDGEDLDAKAQNLVDGLLEVRQVPAITEGCNEAGGGKSDAQFLSVKCLRHHVLVDNNPRGHADIAQCTDDFRPRSTDDFNAGGATG